MSLPAFLLFQVRSTFQSCAKQNSLRTSRQLSFTAALLSRSSNTKAASRKARATHAGGIDQSFRTATGVTPESKQLVRKESEERRVNQDYRSSVPIKVIPKPNLTPNLELSPQQRLHIEALTRRAPQSSKNKQIYKEKLLIYHLGTGREKFLILLKFIAIFSAGFVIAIVAPAHYHAGTSSWLILLFIAGGLVPITVIHALTKSWVTRIFLHLPAHARQTPKSAMEFARNLPANARLDIEYLRAIPLASKVTANIVDLAPVGRSWAMSTFRWIGPRAETGTFWRSNATQFYVRPESSKGKAARFTIPGIWTNVYTRLTGLESEAVSKWSR